MVTSVYEVLVSCTQIIRINVMVKLMENDTDT